jgi:hypothetical protein
MMWVSGDFYQECMAAQTVELAIIDAALATAFGSPAGS